MGRGALQKIKAIESNADSEYWSKFELFFDLSRFSCAFDRRFSVAKTLIRADRGPKKKKLKT